MSNEEVEKIIRSNMSLQMDLAGIRQDFEKKLQRKPLTNQELEKMWDEDVSSSMPDTFTQFKHIVRATEAAHGIK